MDYETKLAGIKSGGVELISDKDIDNITKERTFYGQNWKKYKKESKYILDILSESADVNPKELMKKLELETDEEAGADLAKLNL
jgi:hypothetical protein